MQPKTFEDLTTKVKILHKKGNNLFVHNDFFLRLNAAVDKIKFNREQNRYQINDYFIW